MEAVVSYYTHDATAESSDFMDLDVQQTITCVQLLYQTFLCQNVLPLLRPLAPAHCTPPPISLFLSGPLLELHLIASQTSPTRSPGLPDCVAAAYAEITARHPGGEQPADGIDCLYCQNSYLGRFPTLAL